MSHVNPGPSPRPRPPYPGRGPAVQAAAVSPTDPSQHVPLAMLAGLVALLILVYWDMFVLTSAAWSEALYSHGWIVPVVALGLMWMRWQPFGPVPNIERWLGVALVAAGLLIRLGATYFSIDPIDRLSFLPSIFGVFMMVGGLNIIRAVWPALAFLVFMYPLPSVLERAVLLRLQTFASICSTFVLQLLGVSATRQGNVINIAGMNLAVADACSGLRMLTIFCAMAVAMVFLIERPWWDKFIILLSAVPIALIVNIARITVTGICYLVMGQDNPFAQKLAHDWAGYFMMPLALGILWFELQLLERLTVPVEVTQLRPVGGRGVAVPVR